MSNALCNPSTPGEQLTDTEVDDIVDFILRDSRLLEERTQQLEDSTDRFAEALRLEDHHNRVVLPGMISDLREMKSMLATLCTELGVQT